MIKIGYKNEETQEQESIDDCKTLGELTVYIGSLMRKFLNNKISAITIEDKELDMQKNIETVQVQARKIAEQFSEIISAEMIN